jgi:hypothetical protein
MKTDQITQLAEDIETSFLPRAQFLRDVAREFDKIKEWEGQAYAVETGNYTTIHVYVDHRRLFCLDSKKICYGDVVLEAFEELKDTNPKDVATAVATAWKACGKQGAARKLETEVRDSLYGFSDPERVLQEIQADIRKTSLELGVAPQVTVNRPKQFATVSWLVEEHALTAEYDFASGEIRVDGCLVNGATAQALKESLQRLTKTK